MNTLQNVFNKIATKIELEKHEIELANIGDLVKLTADANNKLKQFNDYYAQLDKLVAPIIKSGQLYVEALNNSRDLYNEIAPKFKDIGLDFTITPEAKAFKDLSIRGERSVIDSMVAKVKNL
jgi:hypothetical protein